VFIFYFNIFIVFLTFLVHDRFMQHQEKKSIKVLVSVFTIFNVGALIDISVNLP